MRPQKIGECLGSAGILLQVVIIVCTIATVLGAQVANCSAFGARLCEMLCIRTHSRFEKKKTLSFVFN